MITDTEYLWNEVAMVIKQRDMIETHHSNLKETQLEILQRKCECKDFKYCFTVDAYLEEKLQ